MEKNVIIDGQSIKFKATAGTPRVYRQAFGRDIYLDFTSLYDNLKSNEELSVESLEIFENVAFIMAMQGDGVAVTRETAPSLIDEWLDRFDTFSIYKIIPEIMDLWRLNTEQTVKPKK